MKNVENIQKHEFRSLRWTTSGQIKCPRGDCPSEVFLVYIILSRAVLSQSTQPAKPIGFLFQVAKPYLLVGSYP